MTRPAATVSRRTEIGRAGDRGDAGFATAFVAVLAVGLIAAAGLVYDGGQLLATYRRASDLAGSAARAGAQELDRDALQTAAIRVDPDGAADRVDAFLADAGHPGGAETVVDGDQVTVTVSLASGSHFLVPSDRQVRATASATATAGVDAARPGS